ncbi:hypothetical protein HJG60_008751 [Phyllostomus discolor]|uniref:Uncharacterized protein n=1 Tax=Phyllostomus discolor TaxID=89673 RepID=A0A833YSF0_9CHIR|nr:hypothetical protein HJG60_008751 [Phyllostomus discolor]
MKHLQTCGFSESWLIVLHSDGINFPIWRKCQSLVTVSDAKQPAWIQEAVRYLERTSNRNLKTQFWPRLFHTLQRDFRKNLYFSDTVLFSHLQSDRGPFQMLGAKFCRATDYLHCRGRGHVIRNSEPPQSCFFQTNSVDCFFPYSKKKKKKTENSKNRFVGGVNLGQQ